MDVCLETLGIGGISSSNIFDGFSWSLMVLVLCGTSWCMSPLSLYVPRWLHEPTKTHDFSKKMCLFLIHHIHHHIYIYIYIYISYIYIIYIYHIYHKYIYIYILCYMFLGVFFNGKSLNLDHEHPPLLAACCPGATAWTRRTRKENP